MFLDNFLSWNILADMMVLELPSAVCICDWSNAKSSINFAVQYFDKWKKVSEHSPIWLQRNYRFFFMFVFSTTLLCIYVFAFCWVYVRRIMGSEDTTIWRAMIKTPASMVLIIYTFISMWFVGGLTAFHLYLISTNQVRDPIFNMLQPFGTKFFRVIHLLV